MSFELKRLLEIDRGEIIELMNHPLILRHMPLVSGRFDDECAKFITTKEKIWQEKGYGGHGLLL